LRSSLVGIRFGSRTRHQDGERVRLKDEGRALHRLSLEIKGTRRAWCVDLIEQEDLHRARASRRR
jgi:hypothetical protein